MSEEEHFNVFEMVPQTQQDLYFNRMQSGVIKASITQTNEENDWFADEELQTEPFETVDKFNQAPRDLTFNYDDKKEQETISKQRKRGNDAIALEKFITQAAPVMEKLVEANNVEYS